MGGPVRGPAGEDPGVEAELRALVEEVAGQLPVAAYMPPVIRLQPDGMSISPRRVGGPRLG